MSQQWNRMFFCLICTNSFHCLWNYAEFDNNTYAFALFTQNTVKQQHPFADVVSPDEIQQFNMCTLDFDNRRVLTADRSLDLARGGCSGWAQQWKWVNVWNSVTIHHLLQRLTLNNPQDLYPDCLAASFPVQWSLAHGSVVWMAWRVCRRSVLLKQKVIILGSPPNRFGPHDSSGDQVFHVGVKTSRSPGKSANRLSRHS